MTTRSVITAESTRARKQAAPGSVDRGTGLAAVRGHAYLFGEATVVSRLREVLAGRGLGQDQISPKAYWGRGRANASHGEPARDA